MPSLTRNLPVAFLLALFFAVGACQKQESSAQETVKPNCYRQAERSRAGLFILRRPLSCSERGHHFRVWGPAASPERIDELDSEGGLVASTRIGYAEVGHPVLEDQVIFKLARVRDLPEKSTRAVLDEAGAGLPLRLVRRLDHGGRVLRLDKMQADRLQERVERRYRGARLVEERGMDGEGYLRYTMRLVEVDGKTYREVYDPGGGLQSRVEIKTEAED